jgi:hypothetical protein
VQTPGESVALNVFKGLCFILRSEKIKYSQLGLSLAYCVNRYTRISRSSMASRSVRFGVGSRKLSNIGQSLDG